MLADRTRYNLLHAAHRTSGIRRLDDRRAADDHVRTCIRARIDRVQAYTTIHFDIQIVVGSPQRSNLMKQNRGEE